jgi:uncharacterized membrane protein YczE
VHGLVVLAVDRALYNEGLMWYRVGTAGVGVAIVVTGLAVIFHKPKPDKPQTPTQRQITRLVGLLLIAAGIAVPVYAWLAAGGPL